jgi:hypothetical protein
MPWHDDREDQPLDVEERELIADNLRRIKDLIYGSVDDPSAVRRGLLGTSGRRREH